MYIDDSDGRRQTYDDSLSHQSENESSFDEGSHGPNQQMHNPRNKNKTNQKNSLRKRKDATPIGTSRSYKKNSTGVTDSDSSGSRGPHADLGPKPSDYLQSLKYKNTANPYLSAFKNDQHSNNITISDESMGNTLHQRNMESARQMRSDSHDYNQSDSDEREISQVRGSVDGASQHREQEERGLHGQSTRR